MKKDIQVLFWLLNFIIIFQSFFINIVKIQISCTIKKLLGFEHL